MLPACCIGFFIDTLLSSIGLEKNRSSHPRKIINSLFSLKDQATILYCTSFALYVSYLLITCCIGFSIDTWSTSIALEKRVVVLQNELEMCLFDPIEHTLQCTYICLLCFYQYTSIVFERTERLL